jgi:hypothetical protein
MRKFTAAEVQAIIEAERRGEFQLPEGDYTDATLTAALERIDTAAAYKITARRAIAEMEQPAPELPAPFLVMDDSDDSAHGTFETWGEARGCIAYDHLSKWTIYRAGQIVESSATA